MLAICQNQDTNLNVKDRQLRQLHPHDNYEYLKHGAGPNSDLSKFQDIAHLCVSRPWYNHSSGKHHIHELDFTVFRAINELNSLYVWLCKPQKGYVPLHSTPEVKPIPNKQFKHYFKKILDDSRHLFY